MKKKSTFDNITQANKNSSSLVYIGLLLLFYQVSFLGICLLVANKLHVKI